MEITIPNYTLFAKKFFNVSCDEIILTEFDIIKPTISDDNDDIVDKTINDVLYGLNNYVSFGMWYEQYDIGTCGITNTLDLFIEQYIPNISFLDYKKLYINCVELSVIKGRSCGYYNDNEVYYIRYQCDIKKLYDFLVTNKLFSEEELM